MAAIKEVPVFYVKFSGTEEERGSFAVLFGCFPPNAATHKQTMSPICHASHDQGLKITTGRNFFSLE